MRIMGDQALNALVNCIKGDLTGFTRAVVPTFEEVYENIEGLDSGKENKFSIVTQAAFDALTSQDKADNNYLVTVDDAVKALYVRGNEFAGTDITGYATQSWVTSQGYEVALDTSTYEAKIDAIFAA